MDDVAAVGLADGSIFLLDLAKECAVYNRGGKHAFVHSIRFAPSGDWFVSTGQDRSGRIGLAVVWSTVDGHEKVAIRDEGESPPGILSCRIAPMGDLLICGNHTGTARLYHMRY